MTVKFDLVRAGRNVEAEVYSYTPLMPAWHRYRSIYWDPLNITIGNQNKYFCIDLSGISAKTKTLLETAIHTGTS